MDLGRLRLRVVSLSVWVEAAVDPGHPLPAMRPESVRAAGGAGPGHLRSKALPLSERVAAAVDRDHPPEVASLVRSAQRGEEPWPDLLSQLRAKL